MFSVGKWTNSFFNGSNETTFALANLNFDFALMKFEAPKEFQEVGRHLSKRRKTEAEDGSLHQTARRLGALFEDVVPRTPELIKAYGVRASEIAKDIELNPQIVPQTTREYGPFTEYIGADATSLWAAVTSLDRRAASHAPLAMHLLACMLAKAWKPPHAISIWAELVASRQQIVEPKLGEGPQNLSAYLAAKQEITREHLALWDSSARSWLRTADEAQKVRTSQLKLILDNIESRMSAGSTTYDRVLNSWQSAMEGMEKCINGEPQHTSDGSILLALSAWHLFPDLSILAPHVANVHFNDASFHRGGTLTIGLQSGPHQELGDHGMQWSLNLSHLRYYGGSVIVKAPSQEERLTMEQLLVAVFGGLLFAWNVPRKFSRQTADWILDLWAQSEPTIKANMNELLWLKVLRDAAASFISNSYEDGAACERLVHWGQRHCHEMIPVEKNRVESFFGLNYPGVLHALSAPNQFEAGIRYLRARAEERGYKADDFFIRWARRDSSCELVEYATAVPQQISSAKRDSEGLQKSEYVHLRWVGINMREAALIGPCLCSHQGKDCGKGCGCYSGLCRAACHPGRGPLQCQQYGPYATNRAKIVRHQSGDHCEALLPGQTQRSGDEVFWENFSVLKGICCCEEQSISPCRCLPRHVQAEARFSQFYEVTGDGEFGLLVKTSLRSLNPPQNFHTGQKEMSVTDTLGTGRAKLCQLDSNLLVNYLTCKEPEVDRTTSAEFFEIMGDRTLPRRWFNSLVTLYYATQICTGLQGPFISSTIIRSPLDKASFFGDVSEGPWLHFSRKCQDPLTIVTRSQAMSCIALFESGDFNIPVSDCEGTVAIASANSIYVSTNLLHDPSYNRHDLAFSDMALNNPTIALFALPTLQPSHEMELRGRRESKAVLRRVIGNLGVPGISLLVSPQQKLRIRDVGAGSRFLPHKDYDGKRENSFAQSTLHLSLTGWKQPLNLKERGTIDDEVYLVECVVAVHDRGKWVADLDVAYNNVTMWGQNCKCSEITNDDDRETMTSIDDWDELLDPPENVGVMRAHGNWEARLAAALIRKQLGAEDSTWLVSDGGSFCRHCSAYTIAKLTKGIGIMID